MTFWNTFFLLLIYIPLLLLWGAAIVDIFRREDIGGGRKAVWLVVVLVVPWIGVIVYMLARPTVTTRYEAGAAAYDPALAGGSTTGQLATLSQLHDQGKLTDEEFGSGKSRLLASGTM